MDPVVLSSAFALVFVAELGDKSQLIAMTLACRYRAAPVIVGVFAAFALLNLLAVAVGAALFQWIPQTLVLLAAGALFLFFAWRTWCDGDDAEAVTDTPLRAHSVALTSFTMILLAELGDKTQLAMVGLAAGSGAPVSVFTGGTAALWAVSLLGILIGRRLLTRLSHQLTHRIAAALFAVFGLLAVAQAVRAMVG